VRIRDASRFAIAPAVPGAVRAVAAGLCCLAGIARPAMAQMSKRATGPPIDLSYLWAAAIGVTLVLLIQRVSNRRRAARRRRERHRQRHQAD
jgi:hypothetical protein